MLYFVGRALLKEDRPTFALHLVHGMNPHLFQPVSETNAFLSPVPRSSAWHGVWVELRIYVNLDLFLDGVRGCEIIQERTGI